MPARPWVAVAAAALTLGLLPLGLPAGTAHASTVDQSYWVPVDQTLRLRGHGFGHGHGMSQYGAYGAARQGLAHQDILAFYYPGTTLGRASGTIRVLLTADTTSDVVVRPAPGLTVRDRATGERHALPDLAGVRRWRLNPEGDRDAVGYYTDRWRRHRLAGQATLPAGAEFVADGPLTLLTPAGERQYRGALRAAVPGAGSAERDTVNVVAVDDYVRGVVPDEMPASWPQEAVRAQAVAARTYGVWSRAEDARGHYDLCDTTSCQVYGGVGAEHPLGDQAVAATSGRVLRYEGRPAFTQFSASSGGWTTAGSRPYLVAQRDPYDDHDRNPVHEWTLTLPASTVERAYPALGRLLRLRVTQRDGHGEWRGRVERVVLDGSRGDVALSGDEARWAFGLRSSWFSVDPTPITLRWNALGRRGSVLGEALAPERRVAGGLMQRFEGGRIWWSSATGAREVHGPVLTEYLRRGASASDLGLPRTGVRERGAGVLVRFERGTVYSAPVTGTHALLGPVAGRYRREGGVASPLGWPVSPTYATDGGERADFERGWVTWDRATGETAVVVTD